MIEVNVAEGVDEDFVLQLVERMKILFLNAPYGQLNPKFKKLEKLYSDLLSYVDKKSVEELKDEILFLEK